MLHMGCSHSSKRFRESAGAYSGASTNAKD
jgi:hypothetical protein